MPRFGNAYQINIGIFREVESQKVYLSNLCSLAVQLADAFLPPSRCHWLDLIVEVKMTETVPLPPPPKKLLLFLLIFLFQIISKPGGWEESPPLENSNCRIGGGVGERRDFADAVKGRHSGRTGSEDQRALRDTVL